jgi:3-oxoacyl-[acyl-carrier protein] reductase
MNLFATVYSCNAVTPIMKQQRSGKIITVSLVAGTAPSADGGYAPLWGSKSRYRPLHAVSGAGSWPVRHHRQLRRPGVITPGRIMSTVVPGSSQSNRDGAELVALQRLGTVEN